MKRMCVMYADIRDCDKDTCSTSCVNRYSYITVKMRCGHEQSVAYIEAVCSPEECMIDAQIDMCDACELITEQEAMERYEQDMAEQEAAYWSAQCHDGRTGV